MAKVDPYISFRKILVRDGRVRILSRKIRTLVRKVSKDGPRGVLETLGALVVLWSIGDDYADEEGVLYGWKPEDIDHEIGVKGFCAALPGDWFTTHEGWAQLPSYQQHNGTTSKTRISDAKRKRDRRRVEKDVRENSDKRPEKTALEDKTDKTRSSVRPFSRGGKMDWKKTIELARRMGKKLVAHGRVIVRNEANDQTMLGACALVTGEKMPEAWLAGAVQAVVDKPAVRNVGKYFRGVLLNKAKDLDRNFDALMASVEIPKEYLAKAKESK